MTDSRLTADTRKRALARLADSTKPADATGRGVGLALVQVVCERRGGSVGVADGPAGGAVFTAVLPR